jgi:trk system potassium uptake protein TrkA
MMPYALIAGGGKVGYYLAATLKESRYAVGMIESDAGRAKTVSDSLGITVILGDATELETLEAAEASQAKYFVALTGSDEANLAACQMAKRAFGVQETVARVSNPGNEDIFRRLGVDATICTTSVAAMTIEKILPANGMRFSPIFSQGDVEMAEIEIEENSPARGKALSEIRLPEDCLLIAVIREDKVSFPRGRTVLERGDKVFSLTRRADGPALRSSLIGGGE